MKRLALASTVVLLGCASSGPSDSTPALGAYRLITSWLGDSGQPQTDTVTITLTFATADSVAGAIAGTRPTQSTFDLGFWNTSAFVVYIPLNSGARIQMRASKGFDSCTGSMFFSFDRNPTLTTCSLTRQ